MFKAVRFLGSMVMVYYQVMFMCPFYRKFLNVSYYLQLVTIEVIIPVPFTTGGQTTIDMESHSST